MSGPDTPIPGTIVVRPDASDLVALEHVVTIGFPSRQARAYLARQLVNPVRLQLVEAERGEPVDRIRCVEVIHSTGQRTWIRPARHLDDGSPAGPYAPPSRVHSRAVVEGASSSSRSLEASDQVVLHVPVQSFMRHLPAIFQGQGPLATDEAQAEPLRQFLLMLQHVLRSVTDPIEDLPKLTDPSTVPAGMLPWLASWVGFDLDESLPQHQQRELVRRAIRLVRTRGTRHGIEEMVRVLTAAPVQIEERRAPSGFVLGQAHLAGGATIEARYRNGERPSAYLSGATPFRSTQFFTLRLEPRARFTERFGERAPEVLRRIVRIVSAERPGHLRFVVRFAAAE